MTTGAGKWTALPRSCAFIVGLLLIGYFVTAVVVRPSMFSDSGWGLLGLDTTRPGLPFNYSTGPDPSDISRDDMGFMSWWSPGQHLAPGLLERLGIGLDLGMSFAVVSAAFSLLGLFGWFALYRLLGFDPATSMIALTIVAASRFFSLPFSIYNGGEVLLFGVAPWFMFMALKLRAFPWYAVPALLAGAFVLVFAKLSGLILAVVTVGAVAVSDDRSWARKDTLRKLAVGAGAVILMGLAFYWLWVSRGSTPLPRQQTIHWDRLVTHSAYAISAIVGGAFSPGDLANRVFLFPGRELLRSVDGIFMAVAPLALALLAFVCWRLRRTHADYLRFFLPMAGGTIVVMAGLWVMGGSISLEERHFRPISMLFIVGLVQACIWHPRVWVRTVFLAAAAASSLYGVAAFANRSLANAGNPLSLRGFRHTIADDAAVKFLRSIDRVGNPGDVPVVLVTSPEMGLEMRHARIIANQADFQSAEDLAGRVYRGRVPRLYVVVQKRLVEDGKAEAILRSFVDYAPDKWVSTPLGQFVAFSQTQ